MKPLWRNVSLDRDESIIDILSFLIMNSRHDEKCKKFLRFKKQKKNSPKNYLKKMFVEYLFEIIKNTSITLGRTGHGFV